LAIVSAKRQKAAEAADRGRQAYRPGQTQAWRSEVKARSEAGGSDSPGRTKVVDRRAVGVAEKARHARCRGKKVSISYGGQQADM